MLKLKRPLTVGSPRVLILAAELAVAVGLAAVSGWCCYSRTQRLNHAAFTASSLAIITIFVVCPHRRALHSKPNKYAVGALLLAAAALLAWLAYYDGAGSAREGALLDPALPSFDETVGRPERIPLRNNCTQFEPSAECPGRSYFGYVNVAFLPGTEDGDHDIVLAGFLKMTRAALDNAAYIGIFAPESTESAQKCFGEVTEAICGVAFPRCTQGCERVKPCLDGVCDSICPSLATVMGLADLAYGRDGKLIRAESLSAVKTLLGNCTDLPMKDGMPWKTAETTGFSKSFVLSDACNHNQVFSATSKWGDCNNGPHAQIESSALGVDGMTTKGEACCACGGGQPKSEPVAEARASAIQRAIDGVISSVTWLSEECGSDALPAGVVEVEFGCVEVALTGRFPNLSWLKSGDAVQSLAGSRFARRNDDESVRSCHLACGTRSACTGFSVAPTVGCIVWLTADPRAVPECQGSTGATGGVVKTFLLCRDEACSGGSASEEENKEVEEDDGRLLSSWMPCSSNADESTSLVPVEPESARCNPTYDEDHKARLVAFEAGVQASHERIRVDADERARLDALVVVHLGVIFAYCCVICIAAANWESAPTVTPTHGSVNELEIRLNKKVRTSRWHLMGRWAGGLCLLVLVASFALLACVLNLPERPHQIVVGGYSVMVFSFLALRMILPVFAIVQRAMDENKAEAAAPVPSSTMRRLDTPTAMADAVQTKWGQVRAALKPFGLRGKYFLVKAKAIEAVEVGMRLAALFWQLSARPALASMALAVLAGVNLLVSPWLFVRGRRLEIYGWDIITDTLFFLLVDVASMLGPSPELTTLQLATAGLTIASLAQSSQVRARSRTACAPC